jgi:muramoyltetrapeptide carboxypeptidase
LRPRSDGTTFAAEHAAEPISRTAQNEDENGLDENGLDGVDSMTDRRSFVAGLAGGLAAAAVPESLAAVSGIAMRHRDIVRPERLRAGDLVGLVAPSGAIDDSQPAEIARESLEAMGLRVREGAHLRGRRGYLAGTDAERASDLNAMIRDPEVRGIFAIRGGWGAARIVDRLDYDALARDPKLVAGYSDITALHAAVHARTGLVTFHSPIAASSWASYPYEHFRRLVFDAEALTLTQAPDTGDTLVPQQNRVRRIHPGQARGRLLGGNLTVLSHLVGTGYLPPFDGAILFLEDIGEAPYRLDRMLTQLKLAGVLGAIAGFIFGRCTDCDPGEGYGSLNLETVLMDHIAPLRIPAWFNAMIGHIRDQWTMPIGIEAEIDADEGSVRLLTPAVT